ncbi:hypothetical protein HanPI659440_Chr04g0170991 [Helianthus annuus]|nr:hypothetical protein HanPI659440_Chr04g0170991 [Helianthus annuus]
MGAWSTYEWGILQIFILAFSFIGKVKSENISIKGCCLAPIYFSEASRVEAVRFPGNVVTKSDQPIAGPVKTT